MRWCDGPANGERIIFFETAIIDAIARGGILSIAALLWVIVLVRMVGLRSFSKMTSFDFIMTVAMGSLVGSAARVEDLPAFLQACAAMAGLFLIQFLIAWSRKRWSDFGQVILNQPLLLMWEGEIIEKALESSRVARGDLMSKLREANVLDLSQVRAVILETTGDVSVLHGDHLEPIILEGVRRIGD